MKVGKGEYIITEMAYRIYFCVTFLLIASCAWAVSARNLGEAKAIILMITTAMGGFHSIASFAAFKKRKPPDTL
jgi:hypothetical protein